MLQPNATIVARSNDLADLIAEFINNGGQITVAPAAAAQGVKKPRK
jgi:hypothetical protein